MPKSILSNKLLVPHDAVDDNLLKRWHYEWKEFRFVPREDELGDLVLDSFGEPVKDKEVEVHTLNTYREFFTASGIPGLSLPRGDLSKLLPLLRRGYRDLRPVSPLGVDLQINPSTKADHRYEDQARCVDEWLRKGYGIIKGDPGSGKTVMGLLALARMKQTTLLMMKQTDGIGQWIGEIRRHTNIDDLEEEHEMRLVGSISEAVKKSQWFPITVATVQTFQYERGKRWLRKHRNSFGLLLLDEVHDFGAPVYSKVVQAINPFSFLGLSATIERTDHRHHLIFDTVGPVVAEGKARQMPPTVWFIETGVEAPAWVYQKPFPDYYQWNVVLAELVKNEERYEIIQKYLRQDFDDGRIVAAISQRRQLARKLYEMMSQDNYDVAYVDGKTPKRVREAIYEDLRQGKYQGIFAGKVLNQLVNLPSVDCLHFVTPAKSKTVTEQGYGRARRWLKGKRNPIIRDYVDSGGQLDGAYKSRVRTCRANGWKIRKIEIDRTRTMGVGIWQRRPRAKK